VTSAGADDNAPVEYVVSLLPRILGVEILAH
jgi:hypothetical protein